MSDAERLARLEERCERLPAIEDKLSDLGEVAARIEQHLVTLNGTVADHETRVRGLERWRYTLPVGIAAGIAGAGRLIETWIKGG